MVCLHLDNDHHSGPHHSSASPESYQYLSCELTTNGITIGSGMKGPNMMMSQEDTQTPPESEKGGVILKTKGLVSP